MIKTVYWAEKRILEIMQLLISTLRYVKFDNKIAKQSLFVQIILHHREILRSPHLPSFGTRIGAHIKITRINLLKSCRMLVSTA